ncbi:MAG TPA: hypothetical protein VHS58_18465 [Acetobacteraceae bacterium]|jgi:hypothetical protein|nr:hypothetical protein [Acetobacteraceae bacterium]
MTRREATAAPARRPSALWLQGLICGAIVTLAAPVALVIAVLLAPTALAMLSDAREDRPPTRGLVLAGLAYAVHPLITLWRSGHDLPAALATLSDFGVIAAAWAAQAGLWLLGEVIPLAVRLALEARSGSRSALLRAERARCVAEWGVSTDQPTGHDPAQ